MLAKQAAWQFIKGEGQSLEFATVNSVAIFGPSLDNHVSDSFNLLKGLLAGSNKRYPNISLNVVDVRDVADLHVRAMFTLVANGKRFIVSADGEISMAEIADLIKNERPQLVEKVATKSIPNWSIEVGALVNKQAKEGRLMLQVNRKVSNKQAKKS